MPETNEKFISIKKDSNYNLEKNNSDKKGNTSKSQIDII